MNFRSFDFRRRRPNSALALLVGAAGFGMAVFGVLCDIHAQDPAVVFEDTIVKIVERVEPSVVSIGRHTPPPRSRSGPTHRAFGRADMVEEQDEIPNEFGAGFLVSPVKSTERYVLTNLHVVRGGPVSPYYVADDGTELRVRFSDRRGCLATIYAADPRSDLAVLRLEWGRNGVKPDEFPSVNWENAPPPRKGQFVLLLGNPYGIARDGSASVSWGLVSNLTRQPIPLSRKQATTSEEYVNSSTLYRLGVVMQLDARLNLGTSGGPVLNSKGELIGISTSLAAIEGYEQSTGFAIPVDGLTRRIVRTLLDGHEVEYGIIGISPGELSPVDFLHLNTGLPQRSAAAVVKVQPGSPADVAKIDDADVVVKVEGVPVLSTSDLVRMVGLHPPDSEIDLTLWRRGRQRLESVKVKLAKWPVRDEEGIVETVPRYAPWRGLSVDYSTARQRGETLVYQRVLVMKVAEGSPAQAARLQPGTFITHVNNNPVRTPAEFYEAVKKTQGIVTLKLSEDAPGTLSARSVQIRD
ncbi:trypsin-like peptidase domain-containing protein [Schlesneria paludicola]|uniref:trypsin-like peptidase domain-containing protein n=1 Tax=Schlesneria paludicola TaxID=360056 RepID=UPI00029A1047|nr:trypsin-like peptidase domain-containing protein [Schlesneria paludicola]